MKLNRKDVQRLASLSAVGAGAVFITADQAEASTIYWSGPQSTNVGWGTFGHNMQATVSVASGFKFRFGTYSSASSSRNKRMVQAYGTGGLLLGGNVGVLQVFNAGKIWTGIPQAAHSLLVASRHWGFMRIQTSSTGYTTVPTQGINGAGNFSNKYALFEFNTVGGPLYGWIELSGANTSAFASNNSFGPSVTIEGWAYDTSGALIAAGDTGASAVPEPGSFALTGLAALALGAAGTRRWRAARNA